MTETASPLTAAAALAAARRIGDELCLRAYWDAEGKRCNWVGRADHDGPTPGSVAPGTAALEADLYRGSAGVAWFLAELAAVTGEEAPLRTAVGAARRSLEHFLRRPPPRAQACSYFLGHLGAARVACRVAELAPEAKDLAEGVGLLLAEVERSLAEPHPLDLLGGLAGAIPALLALCQAPGYEIAGELALRGGEELLATATRQDGATFWEPEKAAGPTSAPALTGFSHGAAGMALALAELGAFSGERSWFEVAAEACAQEDEHFVAEVGNWRDVREAMGAASFQAAWCHGAPGIGLARLRMMELDAERRETYAAKARVALATTRVNLEARLARPRADTSLCHGLCGLAEILWSGGLAFDDAELRDAARAATGVLVDRHGTAGDWPSGMPSGGPSPALFLGAAGVGHHLLRLAAPERVPAVLLVRDSH